MTYHHTQIAFLIVAVMLVVTVACAAGAYFLRPPAARWPLAAIAVVLVGVMVIFSALTVDVRDDAIAWYFGPGFWSYRLARADIQRVAVVRNQWQNGFGIRIGPNFRLYNVEGLDAVELRLKGGEVRRIGTDDPQGLAAALKR